MRISNRWSQLIQSVVVVLSFVSCSEERSPVPLVEASSTELGFVASFPGHCSASVLAPDLVVFAAHCGARFEIVMAGEDAAHALKLGNCFEPDDWALSNGRDMAFCTLQRGQAFETGPPLATAAELARLKVGATVEIVGYGVRHDTIRSGVWRRHSAVGRIARVGTTITLETEGQGICPGDSGGPVLAMVDGKRLLVGIVSARRREQPNCSPGTTYVVRSDRMLEWIAGRQALKGAPPI